MELHVHILSIICNHVRLMVLIALSSNEGSGESAHICRLTRAFAARIRKVPI